MSSKPHNLEQGRLFTSIENGAINTWQHNEDSDAYKAHSVLSNEFGPHTNVAQRAERLIGIMNKLAHRNMLGGFNVAVYDKEHRDDIWRHYLYRTPFVIKHASPKVERLHMEAWREFDDATDFELLKGHGRTLGLGQMAVRTRMEKMWSDFGHDVGHPKTHDNLVKLRRTQEKYLPMDHPLREENRLAKYKNKKKQAQQKAA